MKHHRRLIRRLRARHRAQGRVVTARFRRVQGGWWLIVRDVTHAEPTMYVGSQRLATVRAALGDVA